MITHHAIDVPLVYKARYGYWEWAKRNYRGRHRYYGYDYRCWWKGWAGEGEQQGEVWVAS
jgi:hypothetical protein